MNSDAQNLTLGEATARFLSSLPASETGLSQQEVNNFVRWFGRQRTLNELAPPAIASYAERLSASDTDHVKKLEVIRAFLTHAKKEGWCQKNLAVHARVRKDKARSSASGRRVLPEAIPLTQQGYDELKTELTNLKDKRHEVIDEMRKAAADKDFRENAPLAAARERKGHLEGRIMGLEETLKSAVIVDGVKKTTPKISIGDNVTLEDMASGEELHYLLVSQREVKPALGKISPASPIGKAITGRNEGDVIEVEVPAGKLCYRIKQVGRG